MLFLNNVLNELVNFILNVVEHLTKYKMMKELRNKLLTNSTRLFIKSFNVKLINVAE